MSEITKTGGSSPNTVPTSVWIILASLAIVAYFYGLSMPFLGPDEARYAQVGREMWERSDWITPTLGGFNWFEKPALLYWLEIVSYTLFGVNEFAARFGPALFGIGTTASLWVLGRRFTTENTEVTEKPEITENAKVNIPNSVPSAPSVVNSFANWLAVIAASTLALLVFSHGASFDIIVTFPITAALVSFYIFDQSKTASFRGKYLPLILFYGFTGVALLAKGLIGIVFPFAIVGLFYAVPRRLPSRAFLLSLFWGTILASALAAVWYLPMYMRHGYDFVDQFFIQHHLQRFTSNKYQHPQPFYFFLWVLPLMTLPWLPFFLIAVWNFTKSVVRRFTSSPVGNAPFPPLLLFAAAWLLVPLAFFSFSGSKLPGYILPALPAAVIITALFVFRLVKSSSRWRTVVLTTAASTFAGTVLLMIFAVPRFAELDSVKFLINAANDRGFESNRVLTMHVISHNAEFYAAGRLLRDESGKQRRLYSVNEIMAEIASENGRPAIVMVPLEYLAQLTADERIKTEVLRDNGELAIAVVTVK